MGRAVTKAASPGGLAIDRQSRDRNILFKILFFILVETAGMKCVFMNCD